MKLKEAYELLGLSEAATQEESKKKFRELTKQFHPDICKDPGAEDRFKKINEAYDCVKNGRGSDREESWGNSDFNPNFMDFMGGMRQVHVQEHIQLHTTISFAESILGCKKKLDFNRKVKCEKCNGMGSFKLHNGCQKCGGKGTVTSQQGNMIFSQTCNKCHGKTQTSSCTDCNSTGVNNINVSIEIAIPPGVDNNNILRLGGMGNFVGSSVFGEQYTDAHLHVCVDKDPDLSLQDKNVVSCLRISLLEAIEGCKKTVRTILDNREIEIKPLSRNADTIRIANLGVGRKGDHIVMLDVSYPNNLDKLISNLK